MRQEGIIHVPGVGGHLDDDFILRREGSRHPGIELIPGDALWREDFVLVGVHTGGEHIGLVDIQTDETIWSRA